MPRVLSENVRNVASLRTLTELPFCDLVPLGIAEGATRRLPSLDLIPWGCKGVYTVWVSVGGASPLLVYGGKCAAKDEGIRHRIRVEFNPRQNELKKTVYARHPQGPSRVLLYLQEMGVTPTWYTSYAIIKDVSTIDRLERSMLAKIDFISNTKLNGPLRLNVLESHFKYVPPVVTATGAVVGAVPEMAHDSAPPPKVKKAKKVVVEAPAAVVAEPVAAEKPKKVKKAKVALSEAEIFEKALKAIESDPALAKLAFLAVKACRHKIQTEIGEIQAVVDPLLAQIECKRALLAEITE